MPYHILRADLTTGTISREEVPPELITRFLGRQGPGRPLPLIRASPRTPIPSPPRTC